MNALQSMAIESTRDRMLQQAETLPLEQLDVTNWDLYQQDAVYPISSACAVKTPCTITLTAATDPSGR